MITSSDVDSDNDGTRFLACWPAGDRRVLIPVVVCGVALNNVFAVVVRIAPQHTESAGLGFELWVCSHPLLTSCGDAP